MSHPEPEGDLVHLHDAIVLLRQSLASDDDTRRDVALDGLRSVVLSAGAFRPNLLRSLLTGDPPGPRPTYHYVNAVVQQLIGWFDDDGMRKVQALHYLMSLNAPKWIRGGEFFDHAAPIEAIAETMLKVLDAGESDFSTGAAVIIGMYGDEAEPYFVALLERMEKYWTDCMRAPGIAWALYQIGGLRPIVKEWMLKLAREKTACPHAKEIAQRILRMNQVEW